MRSRELVLLLRLVVVGVFVCVCGIVLRRRGRAVVGGEERLCVGVHSLARVQERRVSPIRSI